MNNRRFSAVFPRAFIRAALRWTRPEALLVLSILALDAHVHAASLGPGPNSSSAPIPLDQLGSVAGEQYHGDGLAVSATERGASLRCVFQKLEGQVTRDGMCLISMADESTREKFRVLATAWGRTPDASSSTVEPNAPCSTSLPTTGMVQVAGQVARFLRPGLTEEYRVCGDGVRQDFIIPQPPGGPGPLRVDLDVIGAKA